MRDGRNLYCALMYGLLRDGSMCKGVPGKILREPFCTEQATIREAEYERFTPNHMQYRAGLHLILTNTRKNRILFRFADSQDIDSLMQDFDVQRVGELPGKSAFLYVPAQSWSRTPICMSAPPGRDFRDVENAILDKPFDKYLDLTGRTRNSLEFEGIYTLRDLTSRTHSQLRRIRDLGKISIKKIFGKLREHGLYLKEQD